MSNVRDDGTLGAWLTRTVVAKHGDVAEVLVEFDKKWSQMIFEVPSRDLAPSDAPLVERWVEPPEPASATPPPIIVERARAVARSGQEEFDETAILDLRQGAERDHALNRKLRLRERGVGTGARALELRRQEWERLQVIRWERLRARAQSGELTRAEKQMLSKFNNQFLKNLAPEWR